MPYSDKKKATDKKYRQTPKGIKNRIVCHWRESGLIVNDIDALYDKYVNTTNCELCNVKLCSGNKEPNRKCMDHCHITGNFRNVVCNSCNMRKLDQTLPKNNLCGIKNVTQRKDNGKWVYRKSFNKNSFTFTNKNKQLVLWVKFVDYLILSQQ